MSKTLLPTINFDSNPGFSEWKFLHQIYSEEFFARSLIGCLPGVVDPDGDPALAPFGTTRPLNVSVNASSPLTLDITQGYAITPNHQLIVLDDNLSALPLPDVVVDKIYVVALEYTLIASAETRLNRFGNLAEVLNQRPSKEPFGEHESPNASKAVTIVGLADFNDVSQFPQSRKDQLVVLATVVARATGTSGAVGLLVDMTRVTFPFIRPWFTNVDIEHRSQIGSGVVTSTNPHALAIQDLSSAGFTLFQQLMARGGVFSKDTKYYGYPGTFCTELFSLNRYQVDEDGSVTRDPEVGLPPLSGRYFVTLTKVPVRVGSLYKTGEPWKPIPYYWKPGTRYIILGTLEQPLTYGTSLTFEYFSVNALMPPPESLSQGVQSFDVGDPTTDLDWIISGGLALNSLTANALNLSATLSPIKKAYQVLCNSDGTLTTSPQCLVPVMKVTDLVANNQIDINQTPLNSAPVRWTIGLTGPVESLSSAPGFDLNLKIRLNGIDDTGSIIEEDITFKASQWREQSADLSILEEEPLQFRTTKTKFQQLNSVQILNTTTDPDNAGSDAVLSFWANILEANANQELASVASFFWDGLGGRRVTDTRFIGTSVQKLDQRNPRYPHMFPEGDVGLVQDLFSVLLDPTLTEAPVNRTRRLVLDTDDDRHFSETWSNFSDDDASGHVRVISFSRITPGMTLRLAPGKNLVFLDSGIPNAAKGEVLIPVSLITGESEIKNNIISVVNNPAFDSTWLAVADDTGIILTRPEAYADGFAVCERLTMVFSGPFLSGSISFSVNGVLVGPISSTGVHNDTLGLIVAAVNSISDQTGVSAVQVSATTNYLVFNGPDNGATFQLTTPVFVAALVTAQVSEPLDAFVLTQPSGGALSTEHLPNRFPGAEKPWRYLSRAIPWVDVKLQAEVSFKNNVATDIQNQDQIEIIPGKILIARKGSPSPAIRPYLGEFLVTSSSLQATLESMRDTINDPTFESGCHAEVDPTNTKLLIEVGGYGSAQITLIAEGVSGTWLVQSYGPVGSGPEESVGFLRAVHPLETAEWRYQLILPAASVGTFTSATVGNLAPNTINIANHGLSNGDTIYFQTTGTLPSGLSANLNYYVVGATTDTFSVSTSLDGAVVVLVTGGVGTHTAFANQPFGPGQWSPYQGMTRISDFAFLFSGPPASSLYTIQIRLKGRTGAPNAISLYQLRPDATGIPVIDRLTAIENRLDDLDDPLTGEITLARGTALDLNSRLSQTIAADGSRIPDPDLAAARTSTVRTQQLSLKGRLDVSDGLNYWLTGSSSNYLLPTEMGNKGIPNQLVSGPSDSFGNSQIFSGSGSILTLLGTAATPIVFSLNGCYYRLARNLTVDFNGLPDGTYYVHAEVRNITLTIPASSAAISVVADQFTIADHGLKVGDHVKFSSTVVLPGGLTAGTTYFVNTVTSSTFEISATFGGPSIDLTSIGTGTHTLTLVDQELGQTVTQGNTDGIITEGADLVNITTGVFSTLNDIITTRKTPLVIVFPGVGVGQSVFFSPIVKANTSNQLQIEGKFPANIPASSYFEIRSFRECSFTVSTTRTDSPTKMAIGQVVLASNNLTSTEVRNYRYQNRYVSSIVGQTPTTPFTAGDYGPVTFNHNLGRLPAKVTVYYHSVVTGDATPLVMNEDVIMSMSTTQVVVTNRVTGVFVKSLSRATITSGFIQVVAS